MSIMKKQWVYYIGFGFIIIALLITGSVILTMSQAPAPSRADSNEVEITISSAPVVIVADGVPAISYDIQTSRFRDAGLNLIRVEVLDKETEKNLQTFDGESLRQIYYPESNPSPSDQNPQTGPGISSLPRISVVLIPDSMTPPRILTHRLTFTSTERATLPFTISGGEIPVPPMSNPSGSQKSSSIEG